MNDTEDPPWGDARTRLAQWDLANMTPQDFDWLTDAGIAPMKFAQDFSWFPDREIIEDYAAFRDPTFPELFDQWMIEGIS